jgi:hypothetical protein
MIVTRVYWRTDFVSWHIAWGCERANDLSLPVPPHIAVAGKRRQHILVAQVLAPCLVLLGRHADLAAEKRQGLTKAVRVEVGQTGGRESPLENVPNGTGAAPVLAVEPLCLEMSRIPDYDFRRRKQRIIETP